MSEIAVLIKFVAKLHCISLNNALVSHMQAHLDNKELCSAQYKMKCVTCVKPQCRKIINPAVPMDGVFAEGGPAGMVI